MALQSMAFRKRVPRTGLSCYGCPLPGASHNSGGNTLAFGNFQYLADLQNIGLLAIDLT